MALSKQEETPGSKGEQRTSPSGEYMPTRHERERHPFSIMHAGSPFGFMRRFSEEMDRLFGEFAGGGVPSMFGGFGHETRWPQIEISEHDHELVVSADLPGLRKDDVQLEIDDGMLVITGERRHESESTEHGFHRSERSYGSFRRAIPLPEDADFEHTKATFHDGVLEVHVPTPHNASHRARKIEIRDKGASTGSPEPQQVSTSGAPGTSRQH